LQYVNALNAVDAHLADITGNESALEDQGDEFVIAISVVALTTIIDAKRRTPINENKERTDTNAGMKLLDPRQITPSDWKPMSSNAPENREPPKLQRCSTTLPQTIASTAFTVYIQ
jgi:hypothetical protein